MTCSCNCDLPPIQFKLNTSFTVTFWRPSRKEARIEVEIGGVIGGVNESATEKIGTSINKMRNLVAEAGLLPIDFVFGSLFTATFKRPRMAMEL